jgi:hypothetical protein
VTFFEGLSRLNHQAEEVVVDMNDMEVRIHEAGWEWKKKRGSTRHQQDQN